MAKQRIWNSAWHMLFNKWSFVRTTASSLGLAKWYSLSTFQINAQTKNPHKVRDHVCLFHRWTLGGLNLHSRNHIQYPLCKGCPLAPSGEHLIHRCQGLTPQRFQWDLRQSLDIDIESLSTPGHSDMQPIEKSRSQPTRDPHVVVSPCV